MAIPVIVVVLTLIVLQNLAFFSFLAAHPAVLNGLEIHRVFHNSALPALGILGLCLLFVQLGLILQRLLRLDAEPILRRLIAFGLGLGFFALGLWLLGLTGQFRRGPVALYTGLTAMALWSRMRGNRLPFFPALPQTRSRTHATVKLLCAVPIGWAFWHGLVIALSPPVAWDSLAVHLALPKLYIQTGHIREIPWMVHQHWPHLFDVLLGVPLLWDDANGAALLHWACAWVVVFGMVRCASVYLEPSVGWVAAALFVAQRVFIDYAGVPHYDAALAAFHFLACLAIWMAFQQKKPGWLAIAGLLSGFGGSTKLIGICLTFILAGWLLLQREGPLSRVRRTVWFLVPALAVVSPWYLWMAIVKGNPVWPFFSSIFADPYGAGAEIQSKLLLVCRWTPRQFWPSMLQFDPQFYLIPLAVFLIPTFLRRRALPPFLRFLLFPALPFFLFLFRYTDVWRFMWPLLPAIFLAIGWMIVDLWRAKGMLKVLVAALTVFALWPLHQR